MALDSTQAKDLVKLAVLVEKIANTGITATIAAGDIEIGAVEIKNATTDTRAVVLAASTASAATDTPLVVAVHPSSPLPIGTNAIGNITTVSTVTAVTAITNALPAGTNLLGKTGIDQTTPGTTNAISIAQIGANTVNTGAGAAGTGTQRIITATDSTIGTVTAVTSITNAVSTKETPDATATYSPDSDISAALEASSVSKASAGVFYGLSGYNSLASQQWILVYNSATVPVNGAVTPIAVIRAAASSNFSFDSGKFGIFCSAGISWSNSTDATIFNKTLGAADCFVNLQYK